MKTTNKKQILTGLDVLVAEKFSRLKNARVAILCNQASVDRNIDHIVSLALSCGINVVKLFAPEHGFVGALQDMEHVGRETFQNIPVISLYGDHRESLALKSRDLDGVDILLCDLQDIGSRYYTFHCTIAWAMKACAQSGTRLMVLDRPNPINANRIEGNLVKETNFSFVGAYPLPNRHGFTMGEIVHYVSDQFTQELDCEVVKMLGYDRALYFDDWDLPFVSPSPNMPSVNAMVVYPGMCLIEGTNLSEGRGTCTPFEIVGAPYITDAQRFKDAIDALDFPGVKLRPCSFKPKFQKHADKTCNGVFVHVVDRDRFQPVRFALGVIAKAMAFDGFSWRHEPYEYETDRLAIDLLLGDNSLRTMLEAQQSLHEIFARYQEEETNFEKKRAQYLLYPTNDAAKL